MKRPAVLMTDPEHYEVRFGANPHTRDASGALKVVDASAARRQWQAYVDALLDHGIDVYVARARPGLTGMVFAANAGFIDRRLRDEPPAEKRFFPSHFMVEHRKPEAELFKEFMTDFGFRVADYDEDLRFEGEADAFPIGASSAPQWVFTYGFRSDAAVHDWLEAQTNETFLPLRLTDPRFYHGDCLVCSLGGSVLAWPGGLADEDRDRLREQLGDQLVEMSDEDAAQFAGNSFYVEVGSDRLLFASARVGAALRGRIEERGVTVIPVDIGEFFGKGGGGPKCMVFNLGLIDPDEASATDDQRRFRARHRATIAR